MKEKKWEDKTKGCENVWRKSGERANRVPRERGEEWVKIFKKEEGCEYEGYFRCM